MNMGQILDFLKPFAAFLAQKVPVLSAIAANGLAGLIAVGLLIEVVEVIASLTATSKDDALVAKAKALRDKIVPILEIFPHMNIPVAAGLGKFANVLKKVLGGLKGLIKGVKDSE
jgi:hypothetical protein